MTNQSDNNLGPDGRRQLSEKEQENCLRMIDGANPSDLGYTMAQAAVILSAYAKIYRQALEKDASLERSLGREIARSVESAESLWEMYREAAALTD